MEKNEELDSDFNPEDIPISEEFWNYMENYWHNNREFPESTEASLNKKADLIDGKVPSSQLPSYVDDVLEFNTFENLPNPGEKGKIYVVTNNNTQFRWSGSEYIRLNSDENVVTITSNQDIIGRKSFITAGGNGYNNNSLRLLSNDGSNPGLTFYKGGVDIATMYFDGKGNFKFRSADDTVSRYVFAQGFKKDGSSGSRILLGDGTDRPVTDFTTVTSADAKYIPYFGATANINLNAKPIANAGSIDATVFRNVNSSVLVKSFSLHNSTSVTSLGIKLTNAGTSIMMGSFTVTIFGYVGQTISFRVSMYKYNNTWFNPTVTWLHGDSSKLSNIEFYKENDSNLHLKVNFVTNFGAYNKTVITDVLANGQSEALHNPDTYTISVNPDNSAHTLVQTTSNNGFVRDNGITNLLNNIYLPLTGGTLTGALTIRPASGGSTFEQDVVTFHDLGTADGNIIPLAFKYGTSTNPTAFIKAVGKGLNGVNGATFQFFDNTTKHTEISSSGITVAGNINSNSGELVLQKNGVNRFYTSGGSIHISPSTTGSILGQVIFNSKNTQFDSNYNLLFGTQTSTGSSLFQSSVATGASGYGLWMGQNLQFNGTDFIQPRGSLGSYAFSVNYHKGFSFNYAAPSGTNDSAVTLTEVLKINATGTITTLNHGDSSQWNSVAQAYINNLFFKNNSIVSREISSTAVTTLDSYLPNGGFITNYGVPTWGGTDAPTGASYGGYLKFANIGNNNSLDFYYNNGHNSTTAHRLWFRTKNGSNGITNWFEFATREWTTTQLANYVTQSSLTGYARLADDQTFTGINTFSQSPLIPWGTLAYHPITLGQLEDYVDNASSSILNQVSLNYIPNTHVVNGITSTNINNWNSAFNFTSNFSTNYNDLVAIEALTGTDGYLRKDGNGQWSLTASPIGDATSITGGKVKLFSDTVQTVASNAVSATAGRTYGIQLNSSGQMVVNIPWLDTNTTYTGSNGITLTGTNFTPTYGTSANTVAQGNDSRINNGQTAFGWGNHAAAGYTSQSWVQSQNYATNNFIEEKIDKLIGEIVDPTPSFSIKNEFTTVIITKNFSKEPLELEGELVPGRYISIINLTDSKVELTRDHNTIDTIYENETSEYYITKERRLVKKGSYKSAKTLI
ncbi:hypothetical protein [Chryseobacterium sp. YIM B08800]|uniref:hypothetical protein n=1 Tax=Chryseobacterium sp. YIM B08800 TaxID=2984136 RepID=UPI00223EAD5D|nr:hypothetical protein [Chryseobacterium sp. YIM B08800]